MAKIERTQVKTRETGTAPVAPAVGAAPVAPAVGASVGITGTRPGTPRRLVGVLFGPPKTAKTTAACSGRNVLLVSFDPDGDATQTLAGRDDVLVVHPRTQGDLDSLVAALHTTDRNRFDWIVVDSLTFLFIHMGGKSITDTWKAGKDVRRAYGTAGAVVQQFAHDLLMLEDTNLIFTAHLEKEGDEDLVSLEQELGESEVKVAVTPMVWRLLAPAVSFIGRTYRTTRYVDVEVDGKRKRNKETAFMVSFNDGERSPAGSRLTMDGEYEITLDFLDTLANDLLKGGS